MEESTNATVAATGAPTDVAPPPAPSESKTPVTVARLVHVYQKGGWLCKHNSGGGRCTGPRAGLVVNAFGNPRANIRVSLDHANDAGYQDALDDHDMATSVTVYEPMTPEQRARMTCRVWAEWPPRV